MEERRKKAQYIADKVKNLRKEVEMSQNQLAEHAGITASAISQIESGNRIPSLIVSRKIATALNISIEELTGDETHSVTKTTQEAQAFFRKYQDIAKLDKQDKKTIINLIKSLSQKS